MDRAGANNFGAYKSMNNIEKEEVKGYGIFHPKGYLRSFEDTGRFQVYVSRIAAEEQTKKRSDCIVKEIVIKEL